MKSVILGGADRSIISIKLSELLYIFFFLLLYTTRILGLHEGNIAYSLVLIVGMLCFFVQLPYGAWNSTFLCV